MAYTTINKSSEHFDTKIYTGNGSSQTLTMDNIGLLWMKRRDSSIRHCLFDSVRGGYYTGSGNAPLLESNTSSNAQGTDINSAAKGITFGATQTVIGNDSAGYSYNVNGHSMVGWQWRANGAGSANTDGSINTTATSANTTAGFSISTYTGTGSASTVGHGLGAVPKMIIVKKISGASYSESWYVYHEALGNTHALSLNSTGASSDVNVWNDTTPTSSVFSVGNDSTNRSGNLFVAYCFAEKQGYSKFGSYKGNGNADGPFIYTGFKPAFVIAKLTSVGGENWYMWDNKRSTGNVMDKFLYPNLGNAEVGSSSFVDFLSNGFKLRSSSDVLNGSGNTHIYMAFAEAPLVGTNGVTAKAR